jgi:hypothetical protein
MMVRRAALIALVALSVVGAARPASAHDGPPFPIVSDHRAGAYQIDVWTDPDATDDGTPGGQFWVLLEGGENGSPVPGGTTVDVSIRASGTDGEWQTRRAEPVDGRAARQFAGLVMNHEGRFDVRVEVAGPLGPATSTAWVNATYDLRPPAAMLIVYLLPFVAMGVLWTRLLLRRRWAMKARPSPNS